MAFLHVPAFFCVVLIASAEECKVENVALHGRAAISSLLAKPYLDLGHLGDAINAIDGNKNADYYAGSCAHTNNEMSPWWRVDLLEPHVIQYVTITNTITEPTRMNGAELLIGNSKENNGNNNPSCAVITSIASGDTQTFQCHGMVGRYVNLILKGKTNYLTPCEVEVYGYPEDQTCRCDREKSLTLG